MRRDIVLSTCHGTSTGNSKVTFSVFKSSCHLLLPVSGIYYTWSKTYLR